MSTEEQACNDIVDHMLEVVARCTSQAEADASREAMMSLFNDCDVKGIRDEKELRDRCFPALESVSCKEVTSSSDWLPDTCRGQILL
jgi:hypothetical protein